VSSSQVLDVRLQHSLRSRLRFARAHWPRWQARALVVLTLTVEFAGRITKAVFSRSRAEVFATVSGYRMLLGDLDRARLRAPSSLRRNSYRQTADGQARDDRRRVLIICQLDAFAN